MHKRTHVLRRTTEGGRYCSLPSHLLPDTMGSLHMRPWVLAVIVFLCVWQSACAEKRASPSGSSYSITFDYGTSTSVLATGGIFTNITGQDGKIFLWSVNPAPVGFLAWDASELLNSDAATPLATATNFSYASVDNAYFQYAATDGAVFYMVTTDGYLLQVDPADLSDDSNSVSKAASLAGAGPILYLENGTNPFMVSASSADTYTRLTPSEMGTSLTSPVAVAPTTLPSGSYVTDDNFGWVTSCQISDTYGYLLGTTKNNVWLFRVNSTGIPEMAMIFRDVWLPTQNGPCYYSADSDNLYIPMVNASIADDEGAVR